MAKSASATLTSYSDPVVPRKGEYNHGDQVKRRIHANIWKTYEKTAKAGSKNFVYCTKKFFAGEVLSQTATHYKVRSAATNRVRTIIKKTSAPCMTPNEYYRDKHTGEWCFCVSVNGTHSKVVPVYSEKLTSSDEEETEKKSESKKDSDSDFDPDDENAKKGKRKKKNRKRKGAELVVTRPSRRRTTLVT